MHDQGVQPSHKPADVSQGITVEGWGIWLAGLFQEECLNGTQFEDPASVLDRLVKCGSRWETEEHFWSRNGRLCFVRQALGR